MNPADYSITVRQVNLDGEPVFEARIRELPDVVEYADRADEAYDLALDSIETTAIVLAEQGRPMPPPFEPVDDYSGRVTLRLPRSLHRSLADGAEAEGVSLNQHLVSMLAYQAGTRSGQADLERDPWISGGTTTLSGPARKGTHLRIVHSSDDPDTDEWSATGA